MCYIGIKRRCQSNVIMDNLPSPVQPRTAPRGSQISLQSFPYGHYATIKDQDLSGEKYY